MYKLRQNLRQTRAFTLPNITKQKKECRSCIESNNNKNEYERYLVNGRYNKSSKMNARMLATQMAITNNWEKEMSLDTWNQTSDSHSKRSHAPTNHWIQMVKMGRKAINKVLIGVEFKLFDFSSSSRYTSTNKKNTGIEFVTNPRFSRFPEIEKLDYCVDVRPFKRLPNPIWVD